MNGEDKTMSNKDKEEIKKKMMIKIIDKRHEDLISTAKDMDLQIGSAENQLNQMKANRLAMIGRIEETKTLKDLLVQGEKDDQKDSSSDS